MIIDYKFWYIKKNNDTNLIEEVGVRFFEGDFITEKVTVDGVKKEVTSYKRVKKLQSLELDKFKGKKAKEKIEYDSVVYTQDDFGNISSNEDLCIFLNKKLLNDKTKSVLIEQSKITK